MAGACACRPKADEGLIAALRGFRRQALHAFALALQHPVSGEPLSWEAAPPEDLQRLIAAFAGGVAPP
jgi:Pseudouridylate synthases, 23S RNA-specific